MISGKCQVNCSALITLHSSLHMSDRLLKVQELLKVELGKILIRELEFPKNSIVTITKVKAAGDLKHATVSIAVTPEKYTGKVLTLLKKSAGHVQDTLNHTLEMHYVPRISFVKNVQDEAERVDEIFDIIDHESKF